MKLPDRRFKNKQKEVLFLHKEISKFIAMQCCGGWKNTWIKISTTETNGV